VEALGSPRGGGWGNRGSPLRADGPRQQFSNKQIRRSAPASSELGQLRTYAAHKRLGRGEAIMSMVLESIRSPAVECGVLLPPRKPQRSEIESALQKALRRT